MLRGCRWEQWYGVVAVEGAPRGERKRDVDLNAPAAGVQECKMRPNARGECVQWGVWCVCGTQRACRACVMLRKNVRAATASAGARARCGAQ